MKKKILAALGALILVGVLASCGIVEHAAYRECHNAPTGRQCSTRVGLVDDGSDQSIAQLVIRCTDGNNYSGGYRQIVGTTSDYGAGTSNPEWVLFSGVCPYPYHEYEMIVTVA